MEKEIKVVPIEKLVEITNENVQKYAKCLQALAASTEEEAQEILEKEGDIKIPSLVLGRDYFYK